jgi:hypothetical protein
MPAKPKTKKPVRTARGAVIDLILTLPTSWPAPRIVVGRRPLVFLFMQRLIHSKPPFGRIISNGSRHSPVAGSAIHGPAPASTAARDPSKLPRNLTRAVRIDPIKINRALPSEPVMAAYRTRP